MYGAIDVGSNTVRLLIGRVQNGRIEPHRYFRRITRLGGGFSPHQGLAPDARKRTLAALQETVALLSRYRIERIRAVGTAILRQAVNSPAFARELAAQTDIALDIIDGEEEARLTALGVCSALDPQPATSLIVDIGGGSTEFVLWHQGQSLLQRSFDLGVVRLAEDLPEPAAQQELTTDILRRLSEDLQRRGLHHLTASPDFTLAGTAGTVTTLAALNLGMADYDWRRINNQVLYRGDLYALQDRLASLSATEREALPGMEQGRGDLILPGLRIVQAVLEQFGRDRLTVSDFGLLEGILLELSQSAQPLLTTD